MSYQIPPEFHLLKLSRYYYKLHPSFPLLLDPVTVIDSYEKEPLLFWTVLTVASKDSETYADVSPLLQKLSMQSAYLSWIMLSSDSNTRKNGNGSGVIPVADVSHSPKAVDILDVTTAIWS